VFAGKSLAIGSRCWGRGTSALSLFDYARPLEGSQVSTMEQGLFLLVTLGGAPLRTADPSTRWGGGSLSSGGGLYIILWKSRFCGGMDKFYASVYVEDIVS